MSATTVIRNTAAILLMAIIGLNARAGDVPQFDERYWQAEHGRARGKVMRGAGLTVIGLASFVPTMLLIREATDDPRGYAGWAAMAALGTVGATLHGFNSVGFGNEQERRSQRFLALYRDNPAALRVSEERAYFFETQKKTTRKVIVFGAVLVAESIIAFSSGITRSVWDHRGEDPGATEIWPAYLVGGILLPAGIFVIARNARKLRTLRSLEASDTSTTLPRAAGFSFSPYFHRDAALGASIFGLFASKPF